METILEITLRSIAISGTATFLSALWSTPIGILLGLRKFRGRFIVKSFFHALLGIPAVALGLILYLIFSWSGPMGFLHLLYRPVAMIIGQAILITPITVSFITNAVEAVDPEIKDLAKTLGASETQASLAVLKESTSGVLLAVTASFNRAIAELGVALMLGGNIRGKTRVLTTTIAMDSSRGEIMLGIYSALLLLLIVFAISFAVNLIQRHGKWRQ